MKVLFTQDVPQVARAGQVKEVADGYARNFLLPKGLAVIATAGQLKNLESLKRAGARRQARLAAEAQALGQLLSETTLTFKVKVGQRGRLYGSITNTDIAQEIEKVAGIALDKRRVELDAPLRQLGSHEVRLRLSKEVTATLKVVVEAEGP